jgi:hypothetical protein
MNAYKMNDVYDYLNQHFIRIDEVIKQTGLCLEQINDLIKHECIPAASYEIVRSRGIRAFVNGSASLKEHMLDRFFPRAQIAWIERVKPFIGEKSLDQISTRLKQAFITELRYAIITLCNQHRLTSDLIDQGGNLEQSPFDECAASTWLHWAKGTYGVCVVNPDSVDRIAMKQLVAAQLSALTDDGQKEIFSDDEADEVRRLIGLYNQYAMPFSPHDVAGSSRQRLVNNVLPKINGQHLLEDSLNKHHGVHAVSLLA